MTLIAVPVFGESIEQIRADLREAAAQGAGLIELRVDLMPGVSDDEIRGLSMKRDVDVPFLLTIRSAAEGGDWEGTEAERIERLMRLAPYFDLVDIEYSLWATSHETRVGLRNALCGVIARDRHGQGRLRFATAPRLILSAHELKGRPEKLHNEFVNMLDADECRAAKIAWLARTVRDNLEAFDLMRLGAHAEPSSVWRPSIIICMGADGLPSRVLAKKFGAFATFASLRQQGETAPGQLTIRELKERFRWDAINEATQIYGVIGDPVAHSLSPDVHNGAFEQARVNAVYLPFRVNAGHESFVAFMLEAQLRHEQGFAGFSVTMPHKVNALRFVERVGGKFERSAARIGAVNTITIQDEGHLTGSNTDYAGVVGALEEGLNGGMASLRDSPVTLLGAGGVARAAVAALVDHGAKVTIYNRSRERGEALAQDFDCNSGDWQRRAEGEPACVVNCTSAGMWPRVDERPFPGNRLQKGQIVFDTVYNPPETRMLRDAVAAGCRVVDGMSMFAHQARAQFERWTGKSLPASFFRRLALAAWGNMSSP